MKNTTINIQLDIPKSIRKVIFEMSIIRPTKTMKSKKNYNKKDKSWKKDVN